MNGKEADGAARGTPACLEGLPPLPKSLSGLLNSSGGSWRDMERVYAKKTMIQHELSRARSSADGPRAGKPASLDAALALLRKEMVSGSARVRERERERGGGWRVKTGREVGLRQQDMSLLCQLWSLHESIQEYKGSCQDLSAGSIADGLYGLDNGYFDEDEEYYPESGASPTETPDGSETAPRNGTSKDVWLQESFHITI
uniref:Protein FAM89A n=1 Tax=Electrophorus electricus TaxID=8005 RepID=A0AAY5EI72_ELEEL